MAFALVRAALIKVTGVLLLLRLDCHNRVHRRLLVEYHSEPNVAAILLGRVDLRVDRKQFRNNMKIQVSLWAVSHVSLSRIGTGRHGGRPSQEPEANSPSIYASPASVPDDTEVVPPKSQK